MSSTKTINLKRKPAVNANMMKYNYNLNDTSSDNLISEDYEKREDDIFKINDDFLNTSRINDDLRKAIKK